MIAAALPLVWALLVVGVAFRYRPAPARVRELTGSAARPRSQAALSAGGARAAGELVERLGRAGLQRAGRPAEPPAARRLGTALVAALAVLPLMPLLAPPTALTAWALPSALARRREQRHQAAVASGLPEVVDLLALAVGSGLTVQLALSQVARRTEGPLAAELDRVVDEVALGRRLADALDDLPGRAGEALRPLVAALVASERYGAPLAAGLDRLADDVRRERRRRAEEAARKVPVKLLFPLVTCTLPAFGLLTVAPLIASAVRSLRI